MNVISRAALLRLFTHHTSSSSSKSLSRFSISHSYKSLYSHFPSSTEAEDINFNSDSSESISNPPISDLQISLQLLSQTRSRFSKQEDVVSFLRSSSIARSTKGLLCSDHSDFGSDFSESISNPPTPDLQISLQPLSQARSRFSKHDDDFSLLRSTKPTKGLLCSDDRNFNSESISNPPTPDLQISLQLPSQARSRFSKHDDDFSLLRSTKPTKGLLCSDDRNFDSDSSESVSNPPTPDLQISLQPLSQARSRFSKHDEDFALLRSSSIAKPTKGFLCSFLWELSSPEADDSDFDSDSYESFSNPPTPDLQISLQLLSQARSRFSTHDDVVAFLRSSSIARPAKGLLCSLLWELRRDWESAILVFRWAGDGVLESPWAWDLMIWVLGKQRRFDLAWMFLRRMHRKSLLSRRALIIMMERYVSANETGKAIRTFHALEKFNVKADLDAFYALLRALCKNKNIEEAEELLLSKRNFFPLETGGFNILLDGWCNILVDLIEAKRIWREMAKYCITPDGTSYTHMIVCLAKHGNLYDSVRLYDEMKKRGCIPNLKVYNYLIYVLTKENCMREAHSIFNKIMEEGLKPDLETYNCMIFSLCEAHKLDEAREIMKTMMLGGIRPSMDTYHAFVKIENFEGVFKLIMRMKEDGYKPNRRTFLLIFDNFFGSGESESALKMWSEMSEYDVTPDIVHYITMIKGLVLHGWIPKAVEFYGEMKAKGFPAEPELEKLFNGIFSNKKSRWGRDSKRYIMRNY